MRKLKNKLGLAIIAILLGLLIGLQIRTINLNTSQKKDGSTLRAKELAELLKKSQEERDRQKEEIQELNKKLYEYENKLKTKDNSNSELYDEIEKLKIIAGLTDVKGRGIELKISVPSNVSNVTEDVIADNPETFLKLISALNAADAEAISINGQRITSTSEVERAGNFLQINGVAIASPYIVKAIGDSDTLKSALKIKSGVVDTLNALGLVVDLTVKEDVEVEKLQKMPDIHFTTEVKTDDK